MTGARRAAFIDRDGTIVVEREYLDDPDDVELVPGTVEALRRLRDAGFALVVVTNQSGIARGLYTEADFHAVQGRVEALLARGGVVLDAVYFCPHHPDYTGACECRKPGLGLFLQAARELDLDLARSIFIGDRPKDIVPARAFGARAFLVRTGYGTLHDRTVGADIDAVDDIGGAVERVLSNAGAGPPRVDTLREPE